MNNSMPHKVFNGKTGVVYNVTKSSVGVLLYKIVDNRYIENWTPWLDVVVVARTAVAVLAAAMGGVRR